ncbi:MAG: superoxide dismutase [Patescibacteria group bacterium]
MFTLPSLPFAPEALAPHISARTLEFHYGKHHQAYIDNLNKLVAGTDLENKSLEEVIAATSGQPDKLAIFNNAAQSYNHAFFWQSLKPDTKISDELLALVESSFGSLENFYTEFKAAAASQFGSGWAWLVKTGTVLEIVKTANANLPDLKTSKPLLVVDVWEHAYYLDYQNRRPDYLEALMRHLLNWDFAQSNLS